MLTAALTGLIIVFIYKRKNAKPLFVKVMWFLISLIFISDSAMELVKIYSTDGHKTELVYQFYFI